MKMGYIFQMATFIGKTSAEGKIMINQWIEGCQTLRQTQMNWLKDRLKIPEL
jgi:ABC-type lipoprotein export system ATPase subunit